MEKNGKILHTFIFKEKEGVRMSMSIDARINTGYNGSNDGVTIFGKRIRINILKKGSMLIKFFNNPIVVVYFACCRCQMQI